MENQENEQVLASVGDKFKICSKEEADANNWNYTTEFNKNDISKDMLVHERVGEINYNTKTPMRIVEYNGANDIWVEFLDEHRYRTHNQYGNFKSGKVKNPYDRTVCGIGYIGVGKYSRKTHPKQYEHWKNAFKRCYCETEYARNQWSAYDKVDIGSNMHCFQDYCKWDEDNYYEVPGEKMVLDKDLLAPISYVISKDLNTGETIYSKRRNNYDLNNICYLPESINLAIREANKVKLFKESLDEEEFKALNERKVKKVRELANKYKQYLPEYIFNKLMDWELTDNLQDLFDHEYLYDEDGNITGFTMYFSNRDEE